MVRAMLAAYRERPNAFVFTPYNTGSLMPRLPEGTGHPLHVMEKLISQAQQEGAVREGPTNLLAAVFAGCVLQSITVATLSRRGALDLLTSTSHDQTIEDAALAAVRSPTHLTVT